MCGVPPLQPQLCPHTQRMQTYTVPPQELPRLPVFSAFSAFFFALLASKSSKKDFCQPLKKWNVRQRKPKNKKTNGNRAQTLHLSIIMKNAPSVNCRGALFFRNFSVENGIFRPFPPPEKAPPGRRTRAGRCRSSTAPLKAIPGIRRGKAIRHKAARRQGGTAACAVRRAACGIQYYIVHIVHPLFSARLRITRLET